MTSTNKNGTFTQFFTSFSTKKVIFIIVVCGVIVFGNVVFNGFVWDDKGFILNNSDVHSINIAHLFMENKFNSISYYRPIPALYFAILYAMSDSQAFLYHVVQISLHILNTIILYLVLRTLLDSFFTKNISNAGVLRLSEQEWSNLSKRQKKRQKKMYQNMRIQESKKQVLPNKKIDWLSLLLSLIFLVHPINVESVAYIAASQSELLFLFGLLAMWVSIKQEIHVKDLLLISGFSLLSLLSKEVGIVFIVLIIGYQFLFKKKRLLKFLMYETSVVLVYLFCRFVIAGVFFGTLVSDVPLPIQNLSFLGRLSNIPAIVLYYLITTFFPLRLAVEQKWIISEITLQSFFIPLLIDSVFFVAICLVGIYFSKYRKQYINVYLFFCLWFIIGLLPLMQLYPLDMTVADRWFYTPLAGLLGMLGVSIHLLFSQHNDNSLLTKKGNLKVVITAVGIIVLLLLSLRTIIRNSNYKNEITLFTHDTKIYDNAVMESDLGGDYVKAGNMKEALVHFQKSVTIYPYPGNLVNLAYTYEQKGDLQKAIQYYSQGVALVQSSSINPRALDEKDLYIHLAGDLLLIGKNVSAKKVITKGLTYYPNTIQLWEELAVSDIKLQNWKEAQIAVEKARNISSNDLSKFLYTSVLNHDDIQQDMPTIIMNQ